MSSTSQTVIRRPRIHGCPERWPGVTVILDRSGLAVVSMTYLMLIIAMLIIALSRNRPAPDLT